MEAAYKELAPRGFKVAAVSIDADGPEVVKAFAAELGLTFDLLQDQSGLIQRTYQTTGVPESFVINRQGKIVKKVIGAARAAGADTFVAGTAVFGAADIRGATRELHRLCLAQA